MTRLALLPAAFLLVLGAASAAPSRFGYAETAVVLSARAGVGGVARPGRWLPVDVTVTSGQRELQGALRVEWGDAIAVRDVRIAAGAEQRFTVLLRAIAGAPVVHLSIPPVSIDVPVELAALEAPLTLCVGDMTDTTCTVRVSEDALPVTWRGFDLADRIVWSAAAQSSRRDAVRALGTWRAMRWLGDEGPADPVLPSFDARTPAVWYAMIPLAALGVAVTFFAAIAAWRRMHVVLTAGVPAIAAGAVAMLMLSPPIGQQSATPMQMSGIVHQFDGIPQATLSAKANIEHPNAAPLVLRPGLTDVTVATGGAGATRSESLEDHEGRAMYRASAGLGARRRLTIDATVDQTWLGLSKSGDEVIVTNRAPFELGDCSFRGATTEPLATLAPGASIAVNSTNSPAAGDTIVCVLPNDWFTWTSDAAVTMRGRMFLVFHFWNDVTEGEPHAAR